MPSDPQSDPGSTVGLVDAEGAAAPVGLARWWVYVLVSGPEGRGRTYVGISTDLERRLRQHNGELPGGARATRAGRPWRLAARHGPYPARGLALRAEHALKQVRGSRRLEGLPRVE